MIDATERAISTWERIQRKPDQISLDRNSTTLTSQTVRITFDNMRATGRGESGGEGTERRGVIYGIKDHPTETMTDVKNGDRFAIGLTVYEVYDVIYHPGSIHAYFGRVTS